MTHTDTYTQVWQDCLDRLQLSITEEEFVKWFLPIEPLGFDGERLRIKVPDRDFAKTIESDYGEVLKPIVAQLFGDETRLSYAIPKNKHQVLDL